MTRDKGKVDPAREVLLQRGRTIVARERLREVAGKDKNARRRAAVDKFKRLHKAGPHWYEIKAYFDPRNAVATPVEDSGFMIGVLEEFVVVEVPESFSQDAIMRIGAQLSDIGVKALVVREGIRFLKLSGCAPEQERQLDAIVEAQRREAGKNAGEPESAEPEPGAGGDDAPG